MQRQGRGGNGNGGGGDGGNRRRGGGGGGGGAFPDPFAGFGGFGFGSSMMQNFFGGRDPFDDPFFNRPFGSLFGGLPNENLFDQRRNGNFLEERPFQSQQENRRGPIIEEIDNDHPHTTGSGQEPIVEHPDDVVRPDRGQRANSRHQGPVITRDDGGVQSYSFQSSSFSYGGPNGNYYASSTSRRRGPNGVVHEEHHEKDSSAKTEMHRVSRGIQDKGHSLTRKRNAEGREENREILHNLGEDEVPEFEKRWETEAHKLPGWNRSSSRSLGGTEGGRRQRAALPSGGSSGWSGRQA